LPKEQSLLFYIRNPVCREGRWGAGLAASALVGIYLYGRFSLYALKENAGASGDDDGGLRCIGLLLYRLLTFGNIVRIDNSYSVYTYRSAKRFKVHLSRRITLDIEARGGVLLVTRHTGNGVIEDDHRGIRAVIGNVDKTRNA
jgi:hypothetical protein